MAKLYFRYASMNAGKSTQILQIHHNYLTLGREVLLMTAKIDDRFGDAVITSRLGVSKPAEVFAADTDMYERIRRFSQESAGAIGAILIDEAQFLSPEQVVQIHRGVHHFKVPVLCYGLRSDFMGRPFPGSAMLLTLAESIEEIKNVCACGAKATMVMRFDANGNRLREGPQIMIGDTNYRQGCARCFYDE